MPKTVEAGRPYPTHTPLGKLMWDGDWKVYELAAEAGIAPRTLTEYLAGRSEISDVHLSRLCQALTCRPEHLVGDR